MHILFIKSLSGKYLPYCWGRKRCIELEDGPLPFNGEMVMNKEIYNVLTTFDRPGHGLPAFCVVEIQDDTYIYDAVTPNQLLEQLRKAGKKVSYRSIRWE